MENEAQKPERSVRATRWILGLSLLAAVIVAARALGERPRFATIAMHAEPWWLLLAVACQVATYPALAMAWRFTIERERSAERAPRLRALVGLALAELFLDQAIPSGGLSGTFFMVTALRRRGVSSPASAAAVGAGLFGFYAAQLAVAVASVASLVARGRFVHFAATVAIVASAAALAIPAGMLTLVNGAGAVARRLSRFTPAERVRRAIESAPRALLFSPATIAIVALMRILIFVLDAATLGACLAALGQPRPFDEVFAGVALASTAASWPDALSGGPRLHEREPGRARGRAPFLARRQRCPPRDTHERREIERLREEDRTQAICGVTHIWRVAGGGDDDRHLPVRGTERVQEIQSADDGHVDVGNDEVEIGWRAAILVLRREANEKPSAIGSLAHLGAQRAKHAGHRGSCRRVAVREENVFPVKHVVL